MNRRGFTMIEVVIAFALAAAVVVSVYSATNSMSAVAARQKQMAIADNERQRFLEILRRDLRGWVTQKENTAGGNVSEGQLLFKFTTSTDALGNQTANGLDAVAARSAQLQYVARGSEVVRIEARSGSEPLSLVVYHGSSAVKAEYFNGKQWTEQWTGKERPVAVRMQDGARQYCVRLQ